MKMCNNPKVQFVTRKKPENRPVELLNMLVAINKSVHPIYTVYPKNRGFYEVQCKFLSSTTSATDRNKFKAKEIAAIRMLNRIGIHISEEKYEKHSPSICPDNHREVLPIRKVTFVDSTSTESSPETNMWASRLEKTFIRTKEVRVPPENHPGRDEQESHYHPYREFSPVLIEESPHQLCSHVKETRTNPINRKCPKGNPTQGEPSKDEPSKDEPIKGEPSKGKPLIGAPTKGKPSKGKPLKIELSKGEPSKGKPSKGEPSKGEPLKGEPSKGEPLKGKPSKDFPQYILDEPNAPFYTETKILQPRQACVTCDDLINISKETPQRGTRQNKPDFPCKKGKTDLLTIFEGISSLEKIFEKMTVSSSWILEGKFHINGLK